MSQRTAGPGVRPIILDQVADILYTVAAAPFSHLHGKILFHQARNLVHISIPRSGSSFAVDPVFPQAGQVRQEILLPQPPQPLFQFPAPWQIFDLPQTGMGIIQMSVPEFRFIGEKAGDRDAEIIMIPFPMRFVDIFDQQTAGFLIHHIDIIPVVSKITRKVQDGYLPLAFRHIPAKSIRFRICRKLNILAAIRLSGYDPQQAVIPEPARLFCPGKLRDHPLCF